MATPQCITFDLDDTLWDHRRAQDEALLETAKRVMATGTVTDFVDRFHIHNENLWDQYRDGAVDAKTLQQQRFARALADVGVESASAQEVGEHYLAYYSRLPYLRPGARQVLEQLAEEVHLGCVTDGFTRVQERKLRTTGIDRHFAFLITSEAVGAPKPSSTMYEAVKVAAGCPADSILHVGDSYEKDVLGAKALGLRAAWIPRSRDEQLPADSPAPDFTLDDLLELPAAIGLASG